MTGTNNNFTSDSDVPKDSDISTNNSMSTPSPDPTTPQSHEDAEDARLREEAARAQVRLDTLLEESREHADTEAETDAAMSELEEGVDELGTDLGNMDRDLTEEEIHAAKAAGAVNNEE